MTRTPGILTLHFDLTARIKTTKGEARVRAAVALVGIADAAAAQWAREYPGEPLPGHLGFERARVEHGKRRDWPAMHAAAQLAQAQGWRGDWARWLDRAARGLASVPRETG
ncbi:MAG: hypothetical protein ACK51F_10590 [Rhodospirillales bacterium]